MREYWCFVLRGDPGEIPGNLGYSHTITEEYLDLGGRKRGKIPVVVAEEKKKMRIGGSIVVVKTYPDMPTARIMKERGAYALITVDNARKNLVFVERCLKVFEKMGVHVLVGFESPESIRAPRDVVALFSLLGMERANAVASLSWRWEEIWQKYIQV